MKEIKIMDKTWKKCLLIFIIVFVVFLIVGVVTVHQIDDIVNSSHVHKDTVTVQEKIHSNDTDFHIVIGSNNKTYGISFKDGNYGKKMFDSIEVGRRYRMTVKDPNIDDPELITQILQVDNETS